MQMKIGRISYIGNGREIGRGLEWDWNRSKIWKGTGKGNGVEIGRELGMTMEMELRKELGMAVQILRELGKTVEGS